jgi:hypothetical protein
MCNREPGVGEALMYCTVLYIIEGGRQVTCMAARYASFLDYFVSSETGR